MDLSAVPGTPVLSSSPAAEEKSQSVAQTPLPEQPSKVMETVLGALPSPEPDPFFVKSMAEPPGSEDVTAGSPSCNQPSPDPLQPRTLGSLWMVLVRLETTMSSKLEKIQGEISSLELRSVIQEKKISAHAKRLQALENKDSVALDPEATHPAGVDTSVMRNLPVSVAGAPRRTLQKAKDSVALDPEATHPAGVDSSGMRDLPVSAAGALLRTLQEAKVPVTFEDVSVHFSQEEWGYLDEGQQELYKEVMKENYESLSFLEMGPQRTDRDLLSRIQQEEQSFAQELQELERELAYSYIGNEDIERETRKENREEHPMGFGLISRQSRNVYENISRRTERGETSQTWQASGKKQRNSARDSLDEVSACERRDRELLNILEHRRHLRAERPFQNNNSDQKTSSLHQREGKEKKSFHCDTCGRSFNSKFSLSLHQRSHTGERPFPCSVCGKCFKQKLSLKLHQRIHTLEKPFLCTECKKTFCRKESLVIHQRVHIAQEQGYLQIAREHAYSTRKRLKPEERLRRRSPERFANDHAYCTEQQLTQQIQKCADMQRPPPAEEREGAQTAAECPAVIEKHLGSCEPASSEGENVKN